MAAFVGAFVRLISSLRNDLNARILLVSAYEPGVEPWEDDVIWLEQIKSYFVSDDDVRLVDRPMSLAGYCLLLGDLDLMIAARLHSSLTAVRLGVPAINLSYTLKGRHIFENMGLQDNVFDVEGFIKSPSKVFNRATQLLHDPHAKARTRELVERVVEANEETLSDFLRRWCEGKICKGIED